MKMFKQTVLYTVIFFTFCFGASLIISGCGKSTLAPGGAYSEGTNAPTTQDYAFFQVDSAFALAYSTCDTAFNFEYNNRAMLWKISPDIKHTLDKIRPQALAISKQYASARSLYLSNPTDLNLSALQLLLTQLQPLTSQAQAAITVKGK